KSGKTKRDGLYRLPIDPERPTSRASCLKRLPARSATRSTSLCSNTSVSLLPSLRKGGAGSTPGRAAGNTCGLRFVLLAQTGIAVEHRQRDERAARMGDAAEISVRDEVQRLLATVVRM